MSALTLVPSVVACTLLAACVTVTDARTYRERNPAFAAPLTPAPTHAQPANLDFRVLKARVKIGSRDYVLDPRERPIITALGDNTYRLDLPLRRDSRSSLRGDETITTHFIYDGFELVFFGDKNRNQRFDRRESGVRYVITHTQELVTRGNKRYVQASTLDVTLHREHISSSQRINSLEMQLIFR